MVWGFLILIIQEFSCVTGQATYFYLLTYFWLLNYFRGLNSGVVGRLLVLWSRENKEILPEGRASLQNLDSCCVFAILAQIWDF